MLDQLRQLDHRPRRLRVAALLAMLCAALVGCGGTTPKEHPDSSTPASTPRASAPAESAPPPTPAPAMRLSDRLLPTTDLRAATGGSWAVHPATPDGSGIGACNRVDMQSIGASKAVRRDYAAGSLTAANVVARVPDRMTARRALKVLESFRTMCDAQPGSLTPVSVAGGTGWWYVSGSDPHADGFGVAVIGTRFSLVALDGGTRAVLGKAMPALVTAAAARIR